MTSLTAVGAAHFDHIARLLSAADAASVPGVTQRFAGGAAFNAVRQFVRAGGTATLHVPGPIVRLRRYAGGVQLCSLTSSATEPSYTAILDSEGELVVAVADMRSYDQLAPCAADVVPLAPYMLVDANLPTALLERLAQRLPNHAKLFAMAVSPAKIVRLAGIAERIDILFCNEREHAAAPLPVRATVVTAGADPVRYEDATEAISHPIDRTVPVDVTGAGDAVTGAFLFANLSGASHAEALQAAVNAARETIAGEGPFPFGTDA